ncbi:prepilin peptidase [Patescibacteria group bacterium]|nr:MAG: prepilin peptidase [Patescibacteria group bacterium]
MVSDKTLFFLIAFFVFLLGSAVGSFLNVVAFRYGSGRSILGRSFCPSCGKGLSFWELVPVLGFFLVGGRCSECKSKISRQYLLAETATGLLFLFTFLATRSQFPPPALFSLSLAYVWFVMSLLVLITLYDIRHKIIPPLFSSLLIVATLVWNIFFLIFPHHPIRPSLSDLLGGVVLFTFFFLLWFISRGRWMGLGDAFLALGIGFFLGWQKSLSAFLLSFWIGAAVSLALLLTDKFLPRRGKSQLRLTGKPVTMKSEVPFAPFLVAGTLLSYFYSPLSWFSPLS